MARKLVAERTKDGSLLTTHFNFNEIWARDDQKVPPGDWFVWLLLAGRGAGKPIDCEEPIRTRRGDEIKVLHIHEVRAGMEVMGHDGEWVMVTGDSFLKNRPCYRIHFNNHHPIVASDDHYWRVWDFQTRRFFNGSPTYRNWGWKREIQLGNSRISKEKQAQIEALIDHGLSYRKIAIEAEVSRSAIRNVDKGYPSDETIYKSDRIGTKTLTTLELMDKILCYGSKNWSIPGPYGHHFIEAIEYVGERKCKCLEVADPYSLYCVGYPGLPTHNTRVGAEYVNRAAEENPGWRIAIVGETAKETRDTMVELGKSSIIQVSKPWFRPSYNQSKARVTWPNGAVGIMFSGDEPDQLRGGNFHLAWVDELAKYKNPGETWDQLEMSVRLGQSPRIIVTTTPRPIRVIKELAKDPHVIVTKTSTSSNRAFLSSRFVDRVVRRYEGTRLGKQELEGEILDDVAGSLWSQDGIDQTRVGGVEVERVIACVVAVDPAFTVSEESSETGIVVGCATDEGPSGEVYLLKDYSGKLSIKQWAMKSVRAWHEHGADCIVAERQHGGDAVEDAIRQATVEFFSDPVVKDEYGGEDVIPIQTVTARKGKILRAQGPSMLWEQGRGHIVGSMPELEDQMTTFTGEEDSSHTDRFDAAVICIRKLLETIG